MSKKSTTATARGKVEDKPPFVHQSGRWCKKVNQRLVYLGSIAADPLGERARTVWAEQKEAIRAGHKPRLDGNAPEGVTVKVLCDAFLTQKESAVGTGELAPRSFQDYHATCLRIADTFGRHRLVADLRPADFGQLRVALAKGVGLVRLKNEMARARVLFNWGFQSELLDNAVRLGVSFKPPSVKNLRIARAEKGPRLFESADLRKIVDASNVPLTAMILLGINCGLGNADCARLKFKHVDLDGALLDFPRPKTGEPRRSPLWPETIKALRAAIAERAEPADVADNALVFITKYGSAWASDSSRNSALSHEFSKILDSAGLKRPGLNFYALRHTLQTIGEGAQDKAALARIMGHVAESSDMSAVYRESINDRRLRAVSDHIRAWLFRKPRKPR